MLEDGEEREGAERRDDASRGASDHRGMERGQQRRSVRSQNRSEQGGRDQAAGARDRAVEARSRRGVARINRTQHRGRLSNSYAARPPPTSLPFIATTAMKCCLVSSRVR